MGRDPLEEIKAIHKHYSYKFQCESTDEDYEDLIVDILNELEDIFNPSRLNGN